MFRGPRAGEPERVGATSPPLGMVAAREIEERTMPWQHDDLLCAWTDGLVVACDASGAPYGEGRLLYTLKRLRGEPVERIVDAVMADADAWSAHPVDDRTLLVLRL